MTSLKVTSPPEVAKLLALQDESTIALRSYVDNVGERFTSVTPTIIEKTKAFGFSTSPDKSINVVGFPSNLSAFTDELPILVLAEMTLLSRVLIYHTNSIADEESYSPYKGDFFLGALAAVRATQCPVFPIGCSKEYQLGCAWVALRRTKKQFSDAWYKVSRAGLSVKSLKAKWKALPRAYNTMQSLLPKLPQYESEDNLVSWLTVNKAYRLPKTSVAKRGLLIAVEKEILDSREKALDVLLTQYNKALEPEALMAHGVPTEMFERASAERHAFLEPVERICTRRAARLYPAGGNKLKSKGKKKTSAANLMEELNFDERFGTFGPWVILGIAPILLPDSCFTQRSTPIRSRIEELVRDVAGQLGGQAARALLTWVAELPM